jgi:SulP family sulfate permease
MAGLTVSFAAISLGAAFGLMSGRGAFAGMIGAAIIPIIASIFGGTRLQASGPTGPMTAVSALTIAFAYEEFSEKALAEQFITLVFMLNAVVLIIAGLIRAGKLISLVPNVVILGFMNGIAVLIWYDQLIKIFGLNGNTVLMGGIAMNMIMALVTLGLIYAIVWSTRRFAIRPQLKSLLSGVLLSIIIMTAISGMLNFNIELIQLGNTLNSVSDFKNMIFAYFPSEILQWKYVIMALPFALQLALLAYLDSLLTALIIDRMTKTKSNLNRELVAQGLANGAAGIFQGIPGAQATIRSVLLLKEGAQTRLAGVLVGVFALLGILVFKNYLTLVPTAVFIGVLFKAGLDVCDRDFPAAYFSNAWHKSLNRNVQLGLILLTTIITVVINLNIAVIAGSILFYTIKYFWRIPDVEPDFQEVSERETKLATG